MSQFLDNQEVSVALDVSSTTWTINQLPPYVTALPSWNLFLLAYLIFTVSCMHRQ